MRPEHFKLTIASIRDRCQPPAEDEMNSAGQPVREKTYRDSEVPGFLIVVRRPNANRAGAEINASFVLQRDMADGPDRRRTVRVTIGRFGMLTPEEARKRARELVGTMSQGINPNLVKRERTARGTTLVEAMEWHLAAMTAKGTAETSRTVLKNELERHLPGWLNRPLSEVTRNECARRHERITKDSGPNEGNRVFAMFRAVWNTAAKRVDLPPNPVVGVTFNKVRRRREPITWEDLPAWWAQVQALRNPVRRDLQVLILLTGLRSEDARTIRWEHLAFERGTMHRPKPKGGVDRAFTVPVAIFVLELLRRRRDENRIQVGDDAGWVFPTRNRGGEVTYVREPKQHKSVRGEDGKRQKVKALPTPHRLRDTFITAAHEARIHPMDLKVLVNHALPATNDVTEGYIRPSIEHLRTAVEAVVAFILDKVGAAGKKRGVG